MTALAGGKKIEEIDSGGDLAKELASLKKEILGTEENKEVKGENIGKELASLKKEVVENKEITKGIEEQIEEALYEKPTPRETYSGGGGGAKINTKEYVYNPDDAAPDNYVLPQRSLAAKVGIQKATANVEKDIADMTSTILGKKRGEEVAEWFIA